MKYAILSLVLLYPSVSYSQQPECPLQYKSCLTEDEQKKILEALKELKNIKESPVKLEFTEPITIVEDWEQRVYINGGEKKPIKLRMTIGDTIDRDLEAQLPIRLYYREEPPDPIFRFRLRAQFGVLAPEVIRSIRDNEFEVFWNASIQLDFLHYDFLNLAINIGSEGFGIGPGIDITKNFGINTNFLVKYDKIYPDFIPTMEIGTYFSFN
jgi:hypothetical protein